MAVSAAPRTHGGEAMPQYNLAAEYVHRFGRIDSATRIKVRHLSKCQQILSTERKNTKARFCLYSTKSRPTFTDFSRQPQTK